MYLAMPLQVFTGLGCLQGSVLCFLYLPQNAGGVFVVWQWEIYILLFIIIIYVSSVFSRHLLFKVVQLSLTHRPLNSISHSFISDMNILTTFPRKLQAFYTPEDTHPTPTSQALQTWVVDSLTSIYSLTEGEETILFAYNDLPRLTFLSCVSYVHNRFCSILACLSFICSLMTCLLV